jgi:Putative prokaryotic signal transducing protein
MKLLFSAADPVRIEKVRTGLITAGVACEVLHPVSDDDTSGIPFYPELWVKHEKDYPVASRVLARMMPG